MLKIQRMIKIMVGATSCALVATLVGCGPATGGIIDYGPKETSPSGVSPSATGGGTGLPAGWRWESYHGIGIGVPGTWGQGTTGWPWCVDTAKPGKVPYVGRPGAVPAILCGRQSDPGLDPGTRLSTGGTFVWLGVTVGKGGERVGTVGDRETLSVGGVGIAVQAPAALRRTIISTLILAVTNHPSTTPMLAE